MTHVLPRLMAAALIKVSQETPGWRESRKIAGKAYSQVSNPFGQDEVAGALAAELSNNSENTKRVINDLIRVLVEYRDLAESAGQDELEETLSKLQQGRDLWLDDRRKSSWIDIPKTEIQRRGMLSQLLGFRDRKQTSEKK